MLEVRLRRVLIPLPALVCLPVSVGKSIRLYLADSTPGGLLTAEIMSWTGHVVAAPRSDLAALLKRDETSRTGIYVLLGDDPESLGGTLADNTAAVLYVDHDPVVVNHLWALTCSADPRVNAVAADLAARPPCSPTPAATD
jgi:hypothetical protein